MKSHLVVEGGSQGRGSWGRINHSWDKTKQGGFENSLDLTVFIKGLGGGRCFIEEMQLERASRKGGGNQALFEPNSAVGVGGQKRLFTVARGYGGWGCLGKKKGKVLLCS